MYASARGLYRRPGRVSDSDSFVGMAVQVLRQDVTLLDSPTSPPMRTWPVVHVPSSLYSRRPCLTCAYALTSPELQTHVSMATEKMMMVMMIIGRVGWDVYRN